MNPNEEFASHLRLPSYANVSHLLLNMKGVYKPFEEVRETLDVFTEFTVHGRLIDRMGLPMAGVLVEMWHTSVWGLYGMEYGPSFVPVDPTGQGWACTVTNEKGEYCFRTTRPVLQADNPSAFDLKITDESGDVILRRLYIGENPSDPSDPFLMDMEIEERQQYFGYEIGGACQFDINI